ncbi:MAG: hypothetical protein HY898_03280 [Deltaproteobacteria bacterium]|nr:hypothetical protein [Deltaproteobacteria bacterium]
MSWRNKKRAPDRDPVDEVGIPLSWLAARDSGAPQRPSGRGSAPGSRDPRGRAPPSSFEILFDEEWPALRGSSALPPPHRNAIRPPPARDSLPRFADELEAASLPVEKGGEAPAAPLPEAQLAQGESVAPVAMPSGLPLDQFIARRHKVHKIAYTAMVGTLCLVAIGVYRWEPSRASPSVSMITAAAMPAAATAAAAVIKAVWTFAPPTAPTSDPAPAQGDFRRTGIGTIQCAEVSIHASRPRISSFGPNSPATRPPPASLPAAAGDAPTADGTNPALAPFDPTQATSAMIESAESASACLRPTDPIALVNVHVVFAPAGTVTTAWVDAPPYSGTPVGGCIARAFRSARMEPFTGPSVTVHRVFQIQARHPL